MAEIEQSAAAGEVHRLTRTGSLAAEVRNASPDRRRQLRAGAVEIAAPLLFRQLTRRVEHGLGHHRCAAGPAMLAPDCSERFHLDLEAVVDDLLAHAGEPIENLPGWITVRLRRSTVDGHRRRRGERGALQRPRVPVWLRTALRDDPWLVALAVGILEWVGTDATAGASLWPLTAWAGRRAALTGDRTAGEGVVGGEVEAVLAAMRTRPTWYQKYVERPLGRKPAPVWMPQRDADGTDAEPTPLTVPAHDLDDAVLRDLAAVAIESLALRLGRGEEPAVVVAEVLRAAFGQVPASYGLDRPPGSAETGAEQVDALITDPARLDRIVAEVLRLLGDDPGDGAARTGR